jgi:hypothetical protein
MILLDTALTDFDRSRTDESKIRMSAISNLSAIQLKSDYLHNGYFDVFYSAIACGSHCGPFGAVAGFSAQA